MISFRFYLVTLVAVFLALAVGVVMGSTLIDQVIVDGLRNRVDTVSASLDERQAANDELRAEVDRLEEYVRESALFSVSARFGPEQVMVVATRGIDAAEVAELVALFEAGGAEVAGVLWIEEKWDLASDEERTELAALFDRDPRSATALQAVAWGQLVDFLVDPAASEPVVDDPLGLLAGGGYVTLEAAEGQDADSLAGAVDGVVLVSGPATDLQTDELELRLGRRLARTTARIVVAEAYEESQDGPARGSVLSAIRSDEALAASVSTVDDVELVEGRVAAVLALADLQRGVVGHYGYGEDAQSALPQWTPP